ncbi:MAG: cobalamin adenosyltransferase [Clostridioides sp.]|jgi:ethanolamine utilization cobalamin adenosyltransferase|nr:cobalamin adenosyltransferase [Clostridioides sp.]
MGVVTEDEIRKQINQNKELKTFYIERGQIVTPSAKSYLSEKNIEIEYVDDKEDLNNMLRDNGNREVDENKIADRIENKIEKNKESGENKEESREQQGESGEKYRYTTVYGGRMSEKPEHMTQLFGDLLVFKDHKRIILRGRLDSLETKILETQVICVKNGMEGLAIDLEEVLSFIRNILRCEVLDEPLEEFTLLGISPEELREQSHYPKKYFGIDHECISYKMGEVIVAINSIRTLVREVELTLYEAFKGKYGEIEREDLMRGLNRLSSLCWILIYKVRTGEYSKENL